jgi:hypothetical protein
MRILLDIPESKGAFFLELLKNLPFVKATLVENNNIESLTPVEKEALELAFQDFENGLVHENEDVVQEMKSKYPNLF